MANNMTGADLIGKTVKFGNSTITFTALDGDKIKGKFKIGDGMETESAYSMSQVLSFIDKGVWKIEGTEAEPKPKAESKPKAEKPKAEKPKADKPKAESKYTYETYENKKGKMCARITGVEESNEFYTKAANLHASGSWSKDKEGNKTFYLAFGPHFAAAAKAVCDAMNEGKTFAECKAIITSASEERAAKKDENKAKRAEWKNSQADTKTQGAKGEKTYTAKDVERKVRLMATKLAEALKVDAAQFEPMVKAALAA